jgi:hypothetical protein
MITTQRTLELVIAAFNDCRRAAASQLDNAQNAELHEANDELHRLLDATKRGECIIPIHAIGKARPAQAPELSPIAHRPSPISIATL